MASAKHMKPTRKTNCVNKEIFLKIYGDTYISANAKRSLQISKAIRSTVRTDIPKSSDIL